MSYNQWIMKNTFKMDFLNVIKLIENSFVKYTNTLLK